MPCEDEVLHTCKMYTSCALAELTALCTRWTHCTHMYKQASTHTHIRALHMHANTHTHTRARTHAHIHMCVCAFSLHEHANVCMHACMYNIMRTHTHHNAHIYIYAHIEREGERERESEGGREREGGREWGRSMHRRRQTEGYLRTHKQVMIWLHVGMLGMIMAYGKRILTVRYSTW